MPTYITVCYIIQNLFIFIMEVNPIELNKDYSKLNSQVCNLNLPSSSVLCIGEEGNAFQTLN